MSTSPKFLLLFSTLMLFVFFLMDLSNIGLTKYKMQDGARLSTQAATRLAVKDGPLKTKHTPLLDESAFHETWVYFGEKNAGYRAKVNDLHSYSRVYRATERVPFAAVQVGQPVTSHSAKHVGAPSVFVPKHRVVYIWDEK